MKPTRPTFYVDLDRTLFITDRVGEIFDAIERLYPDNKHIKGGYERRRTYCVFPRQLEGDDAMYYHDIVAQLRDAGLDSNEVFTRLTDDICDGKFEYPGIAELIQTLQARGEVKILTYGEDLYQRFKVSLCPSLAGIEVVSTVEPKTQYLNENASAGDWIIDDKLMTDIKPGIRVVRIQHYPNVPADVYSLHELTIMIISELPERNHKQY